MKLKRKFIAWLTAAAVLAGMMPGLSAPVFAAGGTAVNGSDALAALGIDTSVAPDGFDASDTVSNPYGRSTIEVTPVKELYTVGMKNIIPYEQQIDTGTQTEIQVGTLKDIERSDNSATGNEANELVSTLYGNEKWGVKTTEGIMSAPAESTVSKGRWIYNGKYAVIASGTYAEGSTSGDSKGYLSGLNNKTNAMSSGFGGSTGADRFGMSDVAAGNFDKNTKGYAAQTVMAYTRDHSHTGGIYLKFGDATTGNYGDPKEVLKAGTAIGNESLMIHDAEGGDQKAENFAENPYQLKNYLQVATGDWNGDGLDEVAVYVPEVGNSRIVVYALQTLQTDDMSNAYKDSAKWKVAWTYHLKEGSVVSNMISLVSADVNQDGIDDLACTWGYYYGPEQNAGSRAVVMFGGKGTEILKKDQEFGLKYGTSDIVRASFVFGDMTGSGDKSLILCGQADSDLKAGNTSSRYVAAYNWNGTQFEVSSSLVKNFDLFGKSDGAYIYSAMDSSHRPGADTDHFYSLPLCAADTAMITRPIGEDGGDLLYFDSLIIKCSDEGLDIAESWDISKAMQGNGALHDYVEYSAESGDMTGQTGAAALAVMTQTLSSTSQETATYKQQGKHNEAVYKKVSYYKNWWHKLWKKKSYRWEFDYWKEVESEAEVNVGYTGFVASETCMTVIDRSQIGSDKSYYSDRQPVDSSMALCMANTDNDSSIMNYTGKHYYTYTDPKILAVLASPPYFKDLLDRDDLSGNYPESTTTYSSSTGSGTGSVGSTTIKAGVYVSYEYEIKIFGVPIGKTEAEMQVTGGFTWETEKTSTLEQTVTYSATSGEDKVAFYSIPMEVYEYISYVPNGKGGYDQVTTTVNIPHEASVRLLSLDAYEAIASDYSVLPKVSENVLTHTLGDPTSYPSSLKPYEKNKSLIASYVGDPAKVGFTSAGGGSTISQEIAMSTEKSNAYIGVGAIEGKVGAGAGGLTVGVVAGFEGSGGKVEISTSGSSFSGELQDMPAEAEAYGYAMNWRIFCYKYDQNGVSFPVVNYIVSDAAQPASLPEDFSQDIAATTDDSVTLTWSYDKMVSGFQLYRYYEFPDGSGSYRLQYVPFRENKGKKNSDGTYSFSYTDKGLNPYTEYSYQIQTESAYKPNVSIYSEPLKCRTKTSVGYPEITVDGLDEDGLLPVYPDKDNATATVSVTDEEKYNGNVSYQWQRLVNNVWTDISGAKSASYTIANASASDEGRYRCRVNVIYYDKTAAQQYHISAYSQDFAAAYSKRTPVADLKVITIKPSDTSGEVNTLHAEIKLHSKNKGSTTAPSGNVVFRISGTDFEKSISVPLAQSSTMEPFNGESKYFATAILDIPDTKLKLSKLVDGAYTVSAYYSGDTVFKDLETEYNDLVLIGDNVTGYQLKLSNKAGGSSMTMFSYSEDIYAELLSKTGSGPLTSVENANVKYILLTESQIKEEAAELAKPEDKQDKTKIFDASKAAAAGDDGLLKFGTAHAAGEYTLRAFDGEKNAAELKVSIKRKSVSIYIEDSDNISANDVDKNLPVVKCDEVSAAELDAFKLGYVAVNSAGNITELKSNMEPGNYIVTPGVTEATPDSFYNNYEPVYRSARYTVIGLTFRISVSAADYTDAAGARPVGKVEIIGNEQAYGDYPSRTYVQFRAIPNAGYQIKEWGLKVGNSDEQKLPGDSIDPQRLSVNTEPATTVVTAYFKPKTITLKAYTDKGGSVKCTSNENFTSGAYVSNGAEFTFMAEPAEGYHFRDWSVSEVGQNTVTHKGTQNDDGTNTLDITVGNENISVRANFERDSYKLTLTGDIKAHYTRQNNAGADVEINVENGAEIVGDTVITVTPKTGYQAAENAVFVVNGEETTESSVYSFELKRDTEVSLNTVRNAYTVSASAENGSVAIKTGTDTLDGNTVENVPGGTAVSFTAHAERGFRLKGWKINGEGSEETGDVLTIPALGENIEAEAVFEAIGSFTATAAVTPAERGRMLYTLKDIYGDIVGEKNNVMPDKGLMVYEGESILFRAEPEAGYMIEQWELDGKYDVSSSKNYPGGEVTVSGDIDVTAYVKSASNYGVSWFTPNPDETTSANGTLSAVADGDALDGNSALVPGGSSVEFKAEPADGYMLDYWTVTDGDGTAAENTEKYMDADGQICVDPVLKIDGLSGHKTVRAYFTEESKSRVTLTTDEAGNAGITYATPLKPSDNGEIADLKSVPVRSGGKTVFWLEPAADHFAKSGDIESDIKKLVNSDAVVTVKYAAGKYTVTVVNLKENLEFAMSDMFEHHKTYEITVPAGVTSDKVKAREGDTVTLTVTPEKGKKLSSLSLSGGAVLNEDVSSSTLVYTFNMPAGPVTVSVTFRSESSGGGGGGSGGGSGGSTPAEPKPSDPKPADPQPGNTPGGADTSKDRLEITHATDINGKKLEIQNNKDGSVTVNTGSSESQPIILDVKNAGAGTAAYIIKPDGTEELVRDSVFIDGKLYMHATDGMKIKAADAGVGFDDVDADSWSADAVAFVSGHGLFNGTGKGTFSPKAEMTREMLMTVIARLNGADTEGDALAKGMAWAVKNGISDGSGPKASITREQIVTMLYRNAGKPALAGGTGALNAFSDKDDISGYAADAMAWAVEKGIIKGMGGSEAGKIASKANATREQVAQMMLNYAASVYR